MFKKLNFEISFLIIITFVSVFSFYLLRTFIETKMFVSKTCGHTKEINARVVGKLSIYSYLAYPDGSIGGHSWMDTKVGDIVTVNISDYSCN